MTSIVCLLAAISPIVTTSIKSMVTKCYLYDYYSQAKSLYISRPVSNFYGTEIEIWSTFGSVEKYLFCRL